MVHCPGPGLSLSPDTPENPQFPYGVDTEGHVEGHPGDFVLEKLTAESKIAEQRGCV